jgi:hypothetical protein
MRPTFFGFLVRLQLVVGILQQLGDRDMTERVVLLRQFSRERARTFERPHQWPCRVTAR